MIPAFAGMLPGLLQWWRPIAIALLVAAALAGIYAKGRNDSTRAWEAKEAARQLAEAKRRVALQQQVDQLGAELETARAKREVVTRTITREVPRYVREPAPQCADTGLHAGGFRVLHDAAAGGVVPDPARVADAPAIDARAAADTIAGNYGVCLEWREQVVGWQRWYSTVTGGAP